LTKTSKSKSSIVLNQLKILYDPQIHNFMHVWLKRKRRKLKKLTLGIDFFSWRSISFFLDWD